MKTRLALLLSLLALAACADNHASVAISGICAPPTDATTCAFSATCGAQYIGRNVIDLAQTNILWVMVQVDNQLPDNSDKATNRTDSNRAYVQEYEVEYTGATIPKATGSIPGSAVVPSNGSATISVFPVNEFAAAALGSLVTTGYIDAVAKVRLKGVFGDTTAFETAAYEIPFRACRNCVVTPVAYCGTKAVTGVCPKGGQLPASITCG